MESLVAYIRKEVQHHYSFEDIRDILLKKGFSEDDVDRAIYQVTSEERKVHERQNRRFNRLFGQKEVFDRIGYGFASQQVINILFLLSGASIFLIGSINGLKTVLDVLFSTFLQAYAKVRNFKKSFIGRAGILYGMSFLFIALATVIKSPALFSLALLLGSIGVVSHGDLYNKFFIETLRKEKQSHFLRQISYYGVIITATSLLIAGYIMDRFPATGAETITLFGAQLPIFGYLIAFELSAIMFILSGYILSFIRKEVPVLNYKFRTFLKEYYAQVRKDLAVFRKSKVIALMLTATVMTGVVQVLINSYYGIFIYRQFFDIGLGGFLNVVVILIFGIVAALLGPAVTRLVAKHAGETPMLVFGILLVSLLPFGLALNPNLLAIGAANALSIIGSAILGIAQGLLALRILTEQERRKYFASISLAVAIPLLVLVPIGAWLAQILGFKALFLGLGFILILFIAPLYFLLVLMSNKAELVA